MQPKGKDLSEETQEYLESWADKANQDVEDLVENLVEYKETYKEEQDLSDEKAEEAARGKVWSEVQGMAQSNAEELEGYILGPTPKKRDANAPKKYRRLREWREGSPEVQEKMIAKGLIEQDGDGNPVVLDDNENSPNHGEPLEPFWVKKIIGIARRVEGESDDFKLLKLDLRDTHADIDIVSGEPVEFMAIVDEETDSEIQAHGSNLTEFNPADIPDLEGVDEIDIYDSADDEYVSNLFSLPDWHAENEDDYNRVVFTEGTIANVGREENQIGLYTIVIGEGTEVGDDPTFVSVDEGQIEEVSFEPGSRVCFAGRTRETPDGSVNLRAYAFEPRFSV